MSARRRLYATATTFLATIVKVGSIDLAGTADWTPVAGDVKVSVDGGNVANIATLPVAVGGAGSVLWKFTLSAAEMSCAEIAVQVVDAAAKTVEDNTFYIETIGSTAALHHDAPAGEGAAI